MKGQVEDAPSIKATGFTVANQGPVSIIRQERKTSMAPKKEYRAAASVAQNQFEEGPGLVSDVSAMQ